MGPRIGSQREGRERRRPFLLGAVVVVGVLCTGAARAELVPLVDAELILQGAAARQDPTALEQLYRGEGVPEPVRGRALMAWLGRDGALEGRERAEVLEALRDPAPAVRLAAVRIAAERKERALERDLLKCVAEDGDPRVRIQGVRALREWTRQGHLYFLDQALRVPWPEVQAEVLVNLSRVAYGGVPPELVEQVRELARRETVSPVVRGRALTVLLSWRLLEWAGLRGLLNDPTVPESLRLHALRLSDEFKDTPDRQVLLLDLLRGGVSLHTAWEAFARLSRSSGGNTPLTVSEAIADYLVQFGERNTATDAMASFLRNCGYQVQHRGGWQAFRP